ncbi:MAG: TldD/PmbA family protein [Candidatus Bathyarchaeota archaeon]
MDLAERLINQALIKGASYACLMHHQVNSTIITVENGVLKSYTRGKMIGLGVRVIVEGSLGIASSTSLNFNTLGRLVEYAIKMAKAARGHERIHFSEVKTVKALSKSPFIKTPDSLADKDKIAIALDTNKSAMLEDIKNSTTHLAWLSELRSFKSSEGTDVKNELMMTGLAQSCISSSQGMMESVSDSLSECAGFEFILNTDWCKFARGIAETARDAVRAKVPKAGFYRVVADQDLIGLILHEAFGHASEADLVMTGESILNGKLGEEVTSPFITIIDEGMVKGGYFFTFDDEGVPKSRQTIVEKGVLVGLLQSRETGYKMGVMSTGNARTQNFGDKPLVRQTNLVMETGDRNFNELIEDIDNGLYICGRGTRGGEVDTGLGTFTFRAGPSYIIRNGKVREMVRGVSVSGSILETLRSVDAVGKDVKVRTSIFGGCGKDGQIARVGHGGPHVRIGKIAVGGGI